MRRPKTLRYEVRNLSTRLESWNDTPEDRGHTGEPCVRVGVACRALLRASVGGGGRMVGGGRGVGMCGGVELGWGRCAGSELEAAREKEMPLLLGPPSL